jgi:hypothetical protein
MEAVNLIKNIKFFWAAIILLMLSSIVNFPFPNKSPFGETILSVVNIPVQNGVWKQFVGIASLVLLILGLFFLTRSLEKYHKRAVLLALIIIATVPSMVIGTYQKTLATGTYAVTYDKFRSNCNFTLVDDSTLNGECELPFENRSEEEVQFTLDFYEEHLFDNDTPVVSLMNNDAPYNVRLQGKESKVVKIQTNIDVSNMKKHIQGGGASEINIIIKSGDKTRKL